MLLVAATMFATAAATPDTGHCDSKPFTLKKPVAAATPAATAQAAPVLKTAPAKPPTPKAKAKPKKYEIGCKQPKS
jgi:hypothetical protein